MKPVMKNIAIIVILTLIAMWGSPPLLAAPTYTYYPSGNIKTITYPNGETSPEGYRFIELLNEDFYGGNRGRMTAAELPTTNSDGELAFAFIYHNTTSDVIKTKLSYSDAAKTKLVATYNYDAIGRLIEKLFADSGESYQLEYWTNDEDSPIKWKRLYKNGLIYLALLYKENGTTVDTEYRYDGKGRADKIIYYDTGEFEYIAYWDDGTANADNIKQIMRFASDWTWLWTKDYYPDGVHVKYYSVPDSDPTTTGDVTRTKYDVLGRVIGETHDDGAYRFERVYWSATDPNDLKVKALYEFENSIWVRSRLYFPDGVTVEIDQKPDPDPNQDGDVVEWKYEINGSRVDLLGETLDTRYFTRLYRQAANLDILRQVVYFDPNWNWVDGYDLHGNGMHIKRHHVKDNDPDNVNDIVILTKYDNTGSTAFITIGSVTLNAGRITYIEKDSGYIQEMIYQDPDNYENKNLQALYEFQRNAAGEKVWIRSTIYHEDGTTPKYIQKPDPNPNDPGDVVEEKYLADGRLEGEKFDDEATGKFTRIAYWENAPQKMKQVILYAPGFIWLESYDLYDTERVKYFHVKDNDPDTVNNIATITKYDDLGANLLITYGSVSLNAGRIIEQIFDDGTRYQKSYWSLTDVNDTRTKQLIDYVLNSNNEWVWTKTTDFFTDGTTPNFEYFADPDPTTDGHTILKEYNSNGNLIKSELDDGHYFTYHDHYNNGQPGLRKNYDKNDNLLGENLYYESGSIKEIRTYGNIKDNDNNVIANYTDLKLRIPMI